MFPAVTSNVAAMLVILSAEEQLQLSELSESGVEEQDESSDEGGLQRFRELKDELIQLEKADEALIAHSGQMSPLLSFPNRWVEVYEWVQTGSKGPHTSFRTA